MSHIVCVCVFVLIFHWKRCQTVLFSFYLNLILNSSGYSCFSQFFQIPYSLQYTTGHYHSPILCLTHLNYPTKFIVRGLSVVFASHCKTGLPIQHTDYWCSEIAALSIISVHIATSDHVVFNRDISSHIRPQYSHRVQMIKSAGSHSSRKIETFLIHY